MSKVQVDTIVDKDDVSAPTFSKGAIVTGVCTATTFVGALTGNADTATTATTTSGNAGGLTGTPSITVNNAVVTSTTVGSAVTANSDGVIITGIATVIGDISQKGSTLDVAADIRHVGDTDTKISFTDNNIALDTAGSTALNIDSSGNVSVGYAGNSLYFQNGFNDSNSRILNGGASNNSDLTFHTRSSGTDGERLRIGSAGEIGLSGANYGTSGQVLTSGGSGAAASWADASGGAWEVISTEVLDGTASDWTSNQWSNTYQRIKLVYNDIYCENTGIRWKARIFKDSTSGNAGTEKTGSLYRGSSQRNFEFGTGPALYNYGVTDDYFHWNGNNEYSFTYSGELEFTMQSSLETGTTTKANGYFMSTQYRWDHGFYYDDDYDEYVTGIKIYWYAALSSAAKTPTGRMTVLGMKYS